MLDAYIAAWRDDIGGGMMNWGKFGLATTRGLFDAQARRDLQNEETWDDGADGIEGLRADNEDQIGILKVVLHESDDFINDHLLSMMGLPDFVGDVREILTEISDVFDDILAYARMPFNPIEEGLLAIETFIEDLIKDAIEETIGVNVETLGEFLKTPSRFLCLDGLAISLPAPIGNVTLPLFDAESKARLDSYLGLAGDHHVPMEGENLPGECGPLADWAQYNPNLFAPVRNAITMSKLLLLDGPTLNQVLSDVLGRSVATYAAGHNIMIQALDPNETWLNLIDGDHAWRADGAPRFSARPAPPQKFDRNKDGTLDADEKQAAKEDIKRRLNAIRASRAGEFDKNHDGVLDESEKQAAKKTTEERGKLVKGRAVEKFDKNSDGKLDEAERATMRAAQKEFLANTRARMLETYDANRDGALDAQEKSAGRAVLQSRRDAVMSRYDTNQDGTLDTAERQAAIAELSKGRQQQAK